MINDPKKIKKPFKVNKYPDEFKIDDNQQNNLIRYI